MLRLFVSVLTVLAGLAGPTPGAEASGRAGLIRAQAELRPWSVKRQGRLSCWVELEAELPAPVGRASVCLDRESWRSWLAAPASSVALSGRWRTSASLADLGEEKKRKVRFHARILGGGPLRGASGRAWVAIEREREKLNTLLEPRDRFGIVRRLMLNQRQSDESGPLLQRVGFVHLLTVTGIHLYALAGFWNEVLSRIGARASRALRISPRPVLAVRRLLVAACWLYAWLLCGCRPGMLRPLAVIAVRGLAERLGWRWRTGAPLLIALVLDLSVAAVHALRLEPEPWAPGRIIYALAVGGGIWAVSSAGRNASHIALSIGSWIFAAHFEAWSEGWVAPLTPVINLLTLPVYCIVLYPGALLTSFASRLTGAELGLSWLEIIELLTEWGVSWVLALPCLFAVAPWATWVGLLAAIAKLTFRIRAPAFCALLLLARLAVEMAPPLAGGDQADARKFRVEQWDVGQGDAAWIGASSGGSGLIDAGSENALTDTHWVSRLSRRRWRDPSRIDWVALTHLDEDHRGGLERLSRIARIRCVAVADGALKTEEGRHFTARMKDHGVPVLAASTSGCLPPGLAFWTIEEGRGRRRDAAGNSRMLGLAVPIQGGWYANFGDAGAELEARFILRLLRDTPWETAHRRILKLSHHGSRFSSSAGFLGRIAPTEAWVSSGLGNTHGHPAAQTLARARDSGVPRLRRTDREGTLSD